MKLADFRSHACAMPPTNPAYSEEAYRFYDREYAIVSYRTDPARLREIVPEPLEVVGATPFIGDLTLGLGEGVYDDLSAAPAGRAGRAQEAVT